MKLPLSDPMDDTGESGEPARWIVELAEKCVGWEACVTTAPELPKIPEDDRAAFLISLQSKIEIVRSVNDEAKANDTMVKWGTSMNDARYKDSAQYDRQYFGAGRQVLGGLREQQEILLLEQIALLHSKCYLLIGVNENNTAAHPGTSTDSETQFNLCVVPVRKDTGVSDYESYCNVHVSYYYKRMSYTDDETDSNGRKIQKAQVPADRKPQVLADRKKQVPADRQPYSAACAASYTQMQATRKSVANGQTPTIGCPCCCKKRVSLNGIQGHFLKEHEAWYQQNWKVQRPLLIQQCHETGVKLK
jgi:hypothetical protein